MSKTLLLTACLLLVISGCGGSNPPSSVCTPGSTLTCTCPGGAAGGQSCNADGSAYGPCVCGGTDGGTPSCGDGTCDSGETCSTCASDCGACPATCGNGACDSGETCSTCASDCGACPPTGCSVQVSADGNTVTDSCGGSDICICDLDTTCAAGCDLCLTPGRCEAAFPRRYALVPQIALVPATKPDGSGWDADGSGPDLFAEMTVDGSAPLRTATANNVSLDADGQFTTFYSGTSREFNLVAGSSIQAEVFDEDLTSNDGAIRCNWNATAAEARRRVLSCDSAFGGFVAWIFSR